MDGRRALFALAWACACGRSPLLFADGGGEGSHSDGDDGDWDGNGGNQGAWEGPQTCREIDFLFVIDNSVTMAPYQSNVIANHQVFIDGITEAVENVETMHVGVVTAAAYPDNARDCQTLGGLVVETGGPGSSNRTCGPYEAGHNYMTERDNLQAKFSCAASVGIGGTDLDAPLAATLAAVSPPLSDAGACNEGFVGPGALLVLVIISDTYPNAFGQFDIDPYFAAAGVVQAVGGFEDIVVVLIASTEESPCLNPLSPGLADFAGLFDHAYIGAICEHDYRKVFTPAVEVVKAACPD